MGGEQSKRSLGIEAQESLQRSARAETRRVMSEGQTAALLLSLLLLILPLSSLIARRPPAGQTLRFALAWVGIFGVGIVLFSFKDEQFTTFTEKNGAPAGTGRILGTEAAGGMVFGESGCAIVCLGRTLATAKAAGREGVGESS